MVHFADDIDKISFFFDDPGRQPLSHQRTGFHSVLYLLRRELIDTIGYDPNTDSEADVDRGGSRHRLFASVLLMFTTIDLLAKFMFGDSGGVADRFRQFLWSPDGGGKPKRVTNLLWAVRNSMVHSFGVPDTDSLTKLGMSDISLAQRKEVRLRGSIGLVVVQQQGDVAVVFVDGLYRTVIESIDRYRKTLYGSGSQQARSHFDAAFSKYGIMRVGERIDSSDHNQQR